MYIILAKGKSIVSDLIASIDGTDVSHVALTSKHVCDGDLVFHSSTQGVEVVSKFYFKKKYDIKRIYEVYGTNLSDSEILWGLLKSYEGARYDYLATIYLGLYLLLSKIGLKIPAQNLWNNRNHFMCLEFIMRGIFPHYDRESMISLSMLEEQILKKMRTFDDISFY